VGEAKAEALLSPSGTYWMDIGQLCLSSQLPLDGESKHLSLLLLGLLSTATIRCPPPEPHPHT
jgi:hypothetical protein